MNEYCSCGSAPLIAWIHWLLAYESCVSELAASYWENLCHQILLQACQACKILCKLDAQVRAAGPEAFLIDATLHLRAYIRISSVG